MPVQGFKTGDRVTTPAGRRALVVRADQRGGRERVMVELFGHTATFATGHNRRVFDARALRPGWPS
jgi:hypothetical protein